ncbi:sensor histidine kinase [Microvirgula aerodenitrificans]|uniref:sensor histidine kinase n=1 Tax=Microvirgula aerodenitrificans TaxID=57480 RepID=UPI00131EF3C0|nr:ATP-binding protein [Microvirgula aerodenitrificans]
MRSLHRHLQLWVLGALSLGALLLLFSVYLFLLEELNEVFDENLKQVALAVATYPYQPNTEHLRQPIRLAPILEAHQQFDFVTQAWAADGTRIFSTEPDVHIPLRHSDGISTTFLGWEQWRIYTIVTERGVAQAAQRVSLRSDVAVEVAIKLIAILILLVLLIAVLLYVSLRRGLYPLQQTADEVAARSAASLTPLPLDELPHEVHPLVSAINSLMARLDQVLDRQRCFIADAAHELRTPITAMKLQLRLLQQAHSAGDRQAAGEDLAAGVARAGHLVNQLLDLSRLEPDGGSLRLETVDLAELARSVVAMASAQAVQAGIDLGAEVREPVTLQADPQQLRILLNNLVDNALHHTPPGGRVDVAAERVDGCPQLVVRDTGCGIPVDERERVLDRFYRVAHSQQTIGSGLGLAIVKTIATLHQASLHLDSGTDGIGLCVSVRFPPA